MYIYIERNIYTHIITQAFSSSPYLIYIYICLFIGRWCRDRSAHGVVRDRNPSPLNRCGLGSPLSPSNPNNPNNTLMTLVISMSFMLLWYLFLNTFTSIFRSDNNPDNPRGVTLITLITQFVTNNDPWGVILRVRVNWYLSWIFIFILMINLGVWVYTGLSSRLKGSLEDKRCRSQLWDPFFSFTDPDAARGCDERMCA